MIAHLRGQLISKSPNQAIVECAGVGYDVIISVAAFSALPEADEPVSLFIYTHVREDQIALFGFLRIEEKHLFERLISVSGIGPKAAINMLSGMAARDIVGAIRGGDLTRLTKIPGIGKKTAERIVLELRDKLEEFGVEAAPAPKATPLEEDVLSALINLGYQRTAAEKAVQQAKSREASDAGFEQLFRRALELLAR